MHANPVSRFLRAGVCLAILSSIACTQRAPTPAPPAPATAPAPAPPPPAPPPAVDAEPAPTEAAEDPALAPCHRACSAAANRQQLAGFVRCDRKGSPEDCRPQVLAATDAARASCRQGCAQQKTRRARPGL